MNKRTGRGAQTIASFFLRQYQLMMMTLLAIASAGCSSWSFKAPASLEASGSPYSVPWAEDGVSKFGPYVLQILTMNGTQLGVQNRQELTFKGEYSVLVSSNDGSSTEQHCQLKKHEVHCTATDSEWIVDYYGGTEEGKLANKSSSSPEIRPIFYGARGNLLGGYSIYHNGVALAAIQRPQMSSGYTHNIWIAADAPNKTWLVATAIIIASFDGRVYEKCESGTYDCGEVE